MKSSVGFLGSNLNLLLLCRFSLSFAPKVLSVACQQLTSITHMPETMPDESHARLNSTAMIYINLRMSLICVRHHPILMPDTGWKDRGIMGLDRGEEERGGGGGGRGAGQWANAALMCREVLPWGTCTPHPAETGCPQTWAGEPQSGPGTPGCPQTPQLSSPPPLTHTPPAPA